MTAEVQGGSRPFFYHKRRIWSVLFYGMALQFASDLSDLKSGRSHLKFHFSPQLTLHLAAPEERHEKASRAFSGFGINIAIVVLGDLLAHSQPDTSAHKFRFR